jgi:hypothetical protein
MASVVAVAPEASRSRMIAFYAFSLIAALFFGGFLYGLPALVVSWFVADPVHEVSVGITEGFLLAGAFLLQLRGASRKIAVAQQAVIVAAVLFGLVFIGSVDTFGSRPTRLVQLLLVIVLVAIPTWLHPARGDLLKRGAVSWPMLALAALVGLGAASYAPGQLALQLTLNDAHAMRLQYSQSAATALAIAAVALLASLRTTGWRIPAWMAGIAAILFGVAGVLYPDASSSLGQSGGAAAIIVGIVFIALAEREARRRSTLRPGRST